MTISLLKYLNVTITLFLLGIWGIVLNRKNIIILLMSIELMLLSINLVKRCDSVETSPTSASIYLYHTNKKEFYKNLNKDFNNKSTQRHKKNSLKELSLI